MVMEEDPATDGRGHGDSTVPFKDPQMGVGNHGTEARCEEEDTTAMDVYRPAQQEGQQSGDAAQMHTIASLQASRPLGFLETMARISWLARAMADLPPCQSQSGPEGNPQAGRR